jgi:hypothetical protein
MVFSELLKFSKNISENVLSSEIVFLMENRSDGIFRNLSFTKMESSKLINYCTKMCCDGKTS